MKFFYTLLSLLLLLFSLQPASAQGLSRWALGRPSLLIDLPGAPHAANVAWTDRPIYSIFPNSWAAEANGVKIEVARIYTSKTPNDVLTEIGQKINAPLAAKGKGVISGREFVNFSDKTRMVAVIGKDSIVSGGAIWALMATYKDEAGFNYANQIFNSVLVEREGGRNWALRSFGRTSLVGDLPFELTEFQNPGDTDKYQRYETHFDGMDVNVLQQTTEANSVFNADDTINGIIEGNRSKPGTTDFRVSKDKTRLGDKTADLITMDFKQGSRNYRIYEIAYIQKNNATLASIKIDPTRADHQKSAEKILRSVRLSNTVIYGWKSQAVGNKGLSMDLPKAPDAPKQQNAVTIYNVDSGLAMVEIRELEVGFPTAHDPDFTAKNYFDIQNAIGNNKFQLVGIEKRLVDGLEARLIKATWKNGSFTNQRQILMILGYQTQWIIDVLAAKETVDYLERVLQSVRVNVPVSPNFKRQSFGKMGVSFLAGEADVPAKTEAIASGDISQQTTAFNNYETGLFLVNEIILRNPSSIALEDNTGTLLVNSLLRGMGQAAGITITATLRDSFPINIDGIEGLHLIYSLKSSNNTTDIPVQGDFIMLKQGDQLWTMLVSTNYKNGLEARHSRARILNSIRVGL